MNKRKTQNKGNLTRVAVYIRVSTDQQAKKGDSLDEQKSTCTKYIDEHDEMILQDIYVDEGISGQKLDRGEFQRLLDNVKENQVDLIVFTKLDRWFRNLKHYLNTQDILDKHNVNWLAVSQPFYDTTTPQGRAFVSQSMIFAELEAQNDSERTRAVFDYKYRQGESLNGRVPMGFSVVDKRIVLNEDAPKAKAIFEYYDQTSNLSKTLRFMEQEYGIVMSQANLKNHFLKNTKYMGKFRDKEDYCPAIVSKELFESVQRKLSMNVKASQKNEYIFSGLLVCEQCGCRMAGRNQRIHWQRRGYDYVYYYPTYVCHLAYPNKRCENRKSFLESTVEKYVLENIRPLLNQYIIEVEAEFAPAVDNQKKIATIQAKMDKLKDLYVNDLITLEEFKKDKAEYQNQIDSIPKETQEKHDTAALREFLEMDFESAYQNMTAAEKRELWRSIIKEIRVTKDREFKILFL